MSEVVYMKSKIEIQFESDIKQVQINSIKTIMGIGDPDEIKQFKRKVWLAYHPDKRKVAADKEIYQPLFLAINDAIKMDEDPASAMELFTHTVKHKYYVEKTIGMKIYSSSSDVPFNFTLPIVKQADNLLMNILKEIYQLTNEDLERANQTYKDYLTSFVEKVLATKKPSPFAQMFMSNKQLENDLFFLINETQDNDLIQQINLLKLHQINFDRFESDIDIHTDIFCKLMSEYLQKNEFKSNLYKIYLNIAFKNSEFKQDEAQVHWLYKRQTYADFTAILLKSPVALALFMVGIATALAIFMPILILSIAPVELIQLCMSSSIATGVMLAWAASIAIGVYFKIDLLEIFERPITPYATFIDRVVDSIFATKPCYTTELANSLADLNDQKVRNQANAGKAQFGMFKTNDSSNEKDFDNTAEESVSNKK